MITRGQVPRANTIALDICDGCNAIHIDMFDVAGHPIATAALPPENWAPFLTDFIGRARSSGTLEGASLAPASSSPSADDIASAIRTAIMSHSSPMVGRGDVHGGQRGYIIYEVDGMPFVIAAILQAVGLLPASDKAKPEEQA